MESLYFGDDDCAAVLVLPELHHAGKRLLVICFAGDVCDVGMDYDDPAVAIAFRRRLPPEGKALRRCRAVSSRR